MAQSKKQKKIIWALDPFEKANETTANLVATLTQLAAAHGGPTKIEPVYVLSPDALDVNVSNPSAWFEKYRPITEKVINQYLGTLDTLSVQGFLPPRILEEKKTSTRGATQALLRYAKGANAQLIAVGTHARKGMSRFFLGSFAETILLDSKIPVLVVGAPPTPLKKAEKIDHILFTTDFSKNSQSLFEETLKLAAGLQAKITLLHAVPHPVEPVFQSGVYLLSGAWVTLPEFLTKEEDRKRELATRYETLAKKKNIPIEVVIDSSHSGISQMILKNAEDRKVQLIAMAAESGRIKSALIGSITRQVVRAAPCPVWVMRLPL